MTFSKLEPAKVVHVGNFLKFSIFRLRLQRKNKRMAFNASLCTDSGVVLKFGWLLTSLFIFDLFYYLNLVYILSQRGKIKRVEMSTFK